MSSCCFVYHQASHLLHNCTWKNLSAVWVVTPFQLHFIISLILISEESANRYLSQTQEEDKSNNWTKKENSGSHRLKESYSSNTSAELSRNESKLRHWLTEWHVKKLDLTLILWLEALEREENMLKMILEKSTGHSNLLLPPTGSFWLVSTIFGTQLHTEWADQRT